MGKRAGEIIEQTGVVELRPPAAGWGTSGNIEDVLSEAVSPAEMKKMRQALGNPGIDASIQRDMDVAKSLSVTSTPTIYFTIKGQAPFTIPAPGLNYSLLKQYLDYLLK